MTPPQLLCQSAAMYDRSKSLLIFLPFGCIAEIPVDLRIRNTSHDVISGINFTKVHMYGPGLWSGTDPRDHINTMAKA